MTNTFDKNTTDQFNYNEKQIDRTDSGLLWFASILPIFGLFLEQYAVSAAVGVILWSLIVIAIPMACIYDYLMLKHDGYDVASLKKVLVLPPLYAFKRELLFNKNPNKGIVMGMFIIAAIFLNGFSQSYSITPKSMESSVKNSSVQSLDNISGNSSDIIIDRIEDYFGKDGEWKSEKIDGGYSVVYTAKKDKKEYVIYFVVKHDGFCYRGFKIENMTIDGKRPKDKEYKQLLKDILIPESNENSESK